MIFENKILPVTVASEPMSTGRKQFTREKRY
jgi:hypothetical protein